jgi:hypothetical protein
MCISAPILDEFLDDSRMGAVSGAEELASIHQHHRQIRIFLSVGPCRLLIVRSCAVSAFGDLVVIKRQVVFLHLCGKLPRMRRPHAIIRSGRARCCRPIRPGTPDTPVCPVNPEPSAHPHPVAQRLSASQLPLRCAHSLLLPTPSACCRGCLRATCTCLVAPMSAPMQSPSLSPYRRSSQPPIPLQRSTSNASPICPP